MQPVSPNPGTTRRARPWGGAGRLLGQLTQAPRRLGATPDGGPGAPGARRAPDTSDVPPPAAREFRGAWLATVKNIDWPSRPGMTSAQMKAELTAMLDRAKGLNLNAVVMQVRPAGDALYKSPHEPWSEFLTGKMGQAPDDDFDPLAFAVAEAHARGMELHAWFNPFRARLLEADGQAPPAAPDHVSKAHPEWVRKYGSYLWMDPGEQAVQDHAIKVMRDVVKRYDIDAIHIDDYFYPYPVKDPKGNDVPFPDDASWRKYVAAGGTLNRDDWRRNNVDRFVERMYREVHAEKVHVKVGVSPFGIWKPGHPAGITGMDPTEKLYADAKLWLQKGWLDYLAPQLYWPIDKPAQSFPKLLQWWNEQNTLGRHMWAGMFTSKVADGSSSAWKAEEISRQIALSRQSPGTSGHIHYSARPLLSGRGGLMADLAAKTYPQPALPPATPWLDANGKPPEAPTAEAGAPTRAGGRVVTWTPQGEEPAHQWAVYTRRGEAWSLEVVPGDKRFTLVGPEVEALAVAALDRAGLEGPRTAVPLR